MNLEKFISTKNSGLRLNKIDSVTELKNFEDLKTPIEERVEITPEEFLTNFNSGMNILRKIIADNWLKIERVHDFGFTKSNPKIIFENVREEIRKSIEIFEEVYENLGISTVELKSNTTQNLVSNIKIKTDMLRDHYEENHNFYSSLTWQDQEIKFDELESFINCIPETIHEYFRKCVNRDSVNKEITSPLYSEN